MHNRTEQQKNETTITITMPNEMNKTFKHQGAMSRAIAGYKQQTTAKSSDQLPQSHDSNQFQFQQNQHGYNRTKTVNNQHLNYQGAMTNPLAD